jgi:hypothetical protein
LCPAAGRVPRARGVTRSSRTAIDDLPLRAANLRNVSGGPDPRQEDRCSLHGAGGRAGRCGRLHRRPEGRGYRAARGHGHGHGSAQPTAAARSGQPHETHASSSNVTYRRGLARPASHRRDPGRARALSRLPAGPKSLGSVGAWRDTRAGTRAKTPQARLPLAGRFTEAVPPRQCWSRAGHIPRPVILSQPFSPGKPGQAGRPLPVRPRDFGPWPKSR